MTTPSSIARIEPAELHFDLPMPPSIWKLYRGNGSSRRKSAIYKQWIGEAGWMLINQRNMGGKYKRIDGEIEVDIRVHRPTSRQRDLDNVLKAIFDLLTSTQTIKDDSQVVSLSARWTDEGVPCTVTVREAA